jgi:tagatose 1,6-diphosphate aldolase GatY/KbaY
MIEQAVALGVCKFNVNTEIRNAYLERLTEYLTDKLKDPIKNTSGPNVLPGKKPELIPLMQTGTDAMQEAVMAKIRLFGSVGRA